LNEIGPLVASPCARSRNAQNAGACLLLSIDDGETAKGKWLRSRMFSSGQVPFRMAFGKRSTGCW